MRIRFGLLFTGCAYFSSLASAQDTLMLSPKKLITKLNLSSLIIFNYRVSGEYFFNNKQSAELELGYSNSPAIFERGIKESTTYSGHLIQVALTGRTILQQREKASVQAGINLAYNYQEFDDKVLQYEFSLIQDPYLTYGYINRFKLSALLTIKEKIYRNLFLECNAGLGIQQVLYTVTYLHSLNAFDQSQSTPSATTRSVTDMNVILNICLDYRF